MKTMSYLLFILTLATFLMGCQDKSATDEKVLTSDEATVKSDERKLKTDEQNVEHMKEQVGEDEYEKSKETMNSIQQ